MKRILSIICMALVSIAIHAQFSSANSFMRKAIVSYSKNGRGFYVKSTNIMINSVDGVKESYAYDKKAQNLYVLTTNSNVVVTLNKDYAKIIKKNKSIPQLSGEELDKEVEKRNSQLYNKFTALNREREQQITDSINKVKQDSIAEVIRRNFLVAAKNKAREEYINSHKSHEVPMGGCSMNCDICDGYIDSGDVFFTLGIRNDTIYYATQKEGKLGLSYVAMHESKLPYSLSSDKDFSYHYEVFKDSLTNDTTDYAGLTRYWNYMYYADYWKQLKKIAPFGFVDDWGWDAEYSMVTFHIRYTNTNSKTIKYLTIYFKITNDVGDVRKTGYFKGTGPLKEGETASWDWDRSSYFTSGDASNMSITKIVITYMNGSTQVVAGKNLKFD